MLVHDGMAGSGHYWAYVKGQRGEGREEGPGGNTAQEQGGEARRGGCWRKFSDMNVTEVDEDEVWSVSRGGTAHASAYCLIYHKTDSAVACSRIVASLECVLSLSLSLSFSFSFSFSLSLSLSLARSCVRALTLAPAVSLSLSSRPPPLPSSSLSRITRNAAARSRLVASLRSPDIAAHLRKEPYNTV